MLCGVTLTLGGSFTVASQVATYTGGTAQALITGITGMGASRKSMANIYNGLPSNWIRKLYSCLTGLKDFRVSVVVDTNDITWLTTIQAKASGCQIIWPAEELYTTGGSIVFMAAMTDYDFGASDIEGRVEGSFTISPEGPPYVAAGSHP